MLEQQLEHTNKLLSDILAALQGHTPAPVTLAAGPEETPEDATVTTPPDQPLTKEAVRDALMGYNEQHGRAATIALMTPFLPAGAKPILSDIPEERYADVIAACAAVERAAA